MPSEAEIDALIERLKNVAGFVQKEHGRVAAASCLATEAAAFLAAMSEERDRRDVQAFDAATAHGKTKLALQKAEARVRELEQKLERARGAVRIADGYLEVAQNDAERPLYNELEVGFRHSPLSPKETIQRYRDVSQLCADFIRRARATLAEIGQRE